MKRCPKCSTTYADETLNFCLDDGEWLVEATSMDEPATAVFGVPPLGGSSSESATRPQIHTTDQTAILPAGSLPGSDPRPTSSAEYLVREASSHKRGIAASVAILLLAVAGIGYWYFNAKTSDSSPISSIAVLPFQNKSSDADTEYLSDGIAESLVYRLSQLPNLKVSPTSSVIRYKGKDTDVAQIAKELEVDAVMSGRLTQRGENLIISVELVDARTKKLLWGEQYDRKMSDLLSTQREIAATIAQKLQVKLSGNEKGLTKKYTDNSEAYQLYLKGRHHFAKRTKDDLLKSIEIFEQAIKLDPNFALAYVGVVESYTVIPSYPYASPAECTPKAKAAVAKALELDPQLPEAHTVSAMIEATDDWNWSKAESEFKRSLEIDPNLAITHYRYGWTYLSPIGKHDDAVAEMKRAMELEPLSIMQGANYAAVLMYARRFDQALEQARKTYDLDPNHLGAQNWLCHTLNAKGLYSEAISIGERAAADQANTINSFNACLGLAYAKTGQREKSLEIIAKIKEAGKTRYVMSYWTAIHYAVLGEKDAAFAELEKAYHNRDWFLQRMKVDPFMDPLRDDPRFKAMLKRLNLPE